MARSERATRPQQPRDETPMTGEDVTHMLGAMPPQMILVGGQALAFWMEHYGIKPGTGAEITSDGDVLGTLEEARLLARRLGGKLRVPPVKDLIRLRPELKEQYTRMALAMATQREIDAAASANGTNARTPHIGKSD